MSNQDKFEETFLQFYPRWNRSAHHDVDKSNAFYRIVRCQAEYEPCYQFTRGQRCHWCELRSKS